MKKLYTLFAIAALAFVACEKENELINTPDEVNEEPVEMTITGYLPEAVSTKTQYDFGSNEGVFSWKSGDQVRLIVANKGVITNLNYNTYTASSISSDGKTAVFGALDTYSGDTWQSTGFAVYPIGLAQNNAASGYSSVFVKIPSATDGTASSIVLIGTPESASSPYNYNFKTAMGVLQVTLDAIPATAQKLRLATNDKRNYPLDGDFSLINNGNLVTISKSNYLSDWGNGFVDVNVSSKQGQTNQSFYFNVPAGEYAAGMLKLEMYDDSDNLLMQNLINKKITFVRNEVIATPKITVPAAAPEWKKLGVGKFIDTPMWGLMKFVENSYKEVGYVDVVIEQNIADNTQYRIKNPYGAASEYLADVNATQSAHTDYLTFSIDTEGKVTFSDFQTGLVAGGINYTIKQSGVSTATDILITGSYTAPEIVQLAPDYYNGDSRQFQRNASNNVVRIIFPSAINSCEGSVSISGSPSFDNGAAYTNNAYRMAVIVSTSSVYKYAADNRYGGYDQSIAPSTKSTQNYSPSGTLTSANLGVNTSFFANSQVLYLYWYTYNSSGTVLMQGCRRFYYLIPSDETAMTRTFTAPSEAECTAAGSNKTPSFYYDNTVFSEPAAYSMVFAPSDDLTKGNIMVKEFAGVSGKAYGYYNASATFPVLLYINNPFCNVGGTDFYLREYYNNVGTNDGQDLRGVARFKLNGTYYGGVNNGIACWGGYFGLYTGNNSGEGGTAGMYVAPFFSIE